MDSGSDALAADKSDTRPSIKQHVGLGHSRRTSDVPREGLVLAPKRPHLVATRHWLQAARWNLSFRSMLSFQQRNRPDWQLLEKPLGVMPARLFLLTWEGDMPNDKPLKPDDFPVDVKGEELVTAEGKPIAKAKTPAIAEDIADRLNEDDCRKEQDRWSA
jgi:hypothetical protein